MYKFINLYITLKWCEILWLMNENDWNPPWYLMDYHNFIFIKDV